LSPLAVNQLLSYTLYPAFSAENVAKGRSPIKTGVDFGWNPPGNALREESTSYPAIAPSNVVLDIEVDRCDGFNEMCGNNTLYVHSLVGAHTANPVNGDFSVECNNAFLRGKPVRAMLYGNIYDALKRVVCQSKPKQVDNTVCGNVLFEKGAFNVV